MEWFFRTHSYYFRDPEEDIKEFIELIPNFILNITGEFIFAVVDEYIILDENGDELIKYNISEEFFV